MRRTIAYRIGALGVAVTAATLLAACHFVTDFDDKRIETTEQKVYVYPEQSSVEGFDVLFVVDTRSVSALEGLRQRVTDWITTLAWGQGLLMGGDRGDPANLPPAGGETGGDPGYIPMEYPIHVGFISANVGLGPGGESLTGLEAAGCHGDGDGGRLLHPPLATPGSAGYAHPFLVIQWGQVVNLQDASGTFDSTEVPEAVNAFWSAVESHASQCAFSQPLGAVRMALKEQNLYNLGFQRPKAGLGLVILSSSDDCSVLDSAFFLDEQGAPRQASPFECFQYGVTCNEADLTTPGAKTGCTDLLAQPNGACWVDSFPRDGPNEPSPTYSPAACFSPASSYAEELTAWMDPYPVAAAVLAGPTTPVVVAQSEGALALSPSEQCTDATAYPGIRLASFAQGLGVSHFTSWCDAAGDDPLSEVMDELSNRAVVRCIPDPLADADPGTPALDPDCTVEHLTVDASGEVTKRTSVPSCASGLPSTETGDCWRIRLDQKGCPTGEALFLETSYGDMASTVQKWNQTQATCTTEKR